MSRHRRRLSDYFKHEAAALVLDQGYSISEAGRSLGVEHSLLRRWVGQLKQERGGVTPAGKALTAEQRKIQELAARINRLEREKPFQKGLQRCWCRASSVVRIVMAQLARHAPIALICSASDITRSCYYAYRRRRRYVDSRKVMLRSRLRYWFKLSRGLRG